MRAINPDQLRAFADVIELGSFSAAAKRLHLTQPAVSQQIKQLETRFALKLFERVGRKVTPTPAGTELMVHARRMEAVTADALEAMARHATGALGRVRIGTGPRLAFISCRPCSASFAEGCPRSKSRSRPATRLIS